MCNCVIRLIQCRGDTAKPLREIWHRCRPRVRSVLDAVCQRLSVLSMFDGCGNRSSLRGVLHLGSVLLGLLGGLRGSLLGLLGSLLGLLLLSLDLLLRSLLCLLGCLFGLL